MKGPPAPDHWLTTCHRVEVCACWVLRRLVSTLVMRGSEKEAREGLLGAVRLEHTITTTTTKL